VTCRRPGGSRLAAVLLLGVVAAGCDAATPSVDPGPSTSAPSTTFPASPAPSDAVPVVHGPPLPHVLDVDRVRNVRLPMDPAVLPPGPPTRVPWTEFDGPSELGEVLRMHVGPRSYPLRESGYLREVAVWPTGVVWFQDYGLRFLNRDTGKVTRVRGVPAWYGRLTFTPDRAFWVKDGWVWSLSAQGLTPRTEARLTEVAGIEDASILVRGRVLGVLAGGEVMVEVTQGQGRSRSSAVYASDGRALPLPPSWDYVTSERSRVAVVSKPGRSVLAAYDTRTFEPLWSRSVQAGGRRLRVVVGPLSPSGRRMLVPGVRGGALVIETRTGKPVARATLAPSSSAMQGEMHLDDDTHVVYSAYDGPPNPGFDPTDTEPEVVELDWPNVLARCALSGACERVASVPAPERSLMTGATYLFDRP